MNRVFSFIKHRRQFLVPVVAALFFLSFVFLFYPFRSRFQFDTDEGFNLMRSMLVSSGYHLYQQVSSDQPPLFTYLLIPLLRLTGMSVNPARMLVLLFSTLLVWSFAQFLQLTWGSLSALLLPLLLLLLPWYIQLSASVMIGIPALSLAALSLLFLLFWHRNRRTIWLILSGIVLGISMMIKMFTLFLIPIYLAGLAAAELKIHSGGRFKLFFLQPAIIWLVSFLSTFAVLLFILVKPAFWLDLFKSHLLSPTVEFFHTEKFTLNFLLNRDNAIPFLLLAILSLIFIFKTRRYVTLYLVAWFASAFLLLQFYSPVWYHHQLLVTVPAVALGAVSAGEGMRLTFNAFQTRNFSNWISLAGLVAVIGLFYVLASSLPDLNRQLAAPRLTGVTLQDSRNRMNVYHLMQEYAPQTNWVVTDLPIYAYRINKPVPPGLATFSSKRVMTGSLTRAEILSTIKQYRPEQVLFTRFESPEVNRYLDENYNLIYEQNGFRLYIRSDLPVNSTQ